MDLLSGRRARGPIAMGGALALAYGPVRAARAAPLDVAVDFRSDGTTGENAAWRCYILAREKYKT